MACEMCGNDKVAAIVKIEGVQMSVCERCATHGTLVRNIAAPAPKKSRAQVLAPALRERKPTEELIEQVRPDLARLLREHRERLKLDHDRFAARLGIRASTYHHYENGSAKPDIPTARKMEHELKVPLVVHVKVAAPPTGTAPKDDGRGMQLGDFFRKR